MNANTVRIKVDATNPGQFFACCGLLELANRLWPGAEGWFEAGEFRIHTPGSLGDLLTKTMTAAMSQVDASDSKASPLHLEAPFDLRLDWWLDGSGGGRDLKVWAGSMNCVRIARSLRLALSDPRYQSAQLLNIGTTLHDPDEPDKKVEPFLFDSRRAANAHSRDLGFSPNDLSMTTTAYPAVEFFCLVGLQRCLPAATGRRRVYDYHAWSRPIAALLMRPVVCGVLHLPGSRVYRFETWFRTAQKKHKTFRQAIVLAKGE